MRAVVLEQYGGPEVLAVREIPEPVLGPEEVLVEVRSSALNRADVLQRMGLYRGPKMAHEVPGLEFAGTVVAAGERVADRAVGDTVMGIVGGGAHAELLAVHERQTMRVPDSVELADAGAIPEVWITAYDALVLQGGLTAGRTALVHAGASGVGTAGIQIARAVGARVVVTASSGKVAACRELGADLSVDYGSEDFVAAVLEFTGGQGADVVLDVIGGDYTDRNVAAVANQGAIVQVGTMGSGRAEVNLLGLMQKRARLVGTVLRARPLEEKIAVTRRFAAEILPLFDRGRCHPVIDSRYPLGQIAEAHRAMEANVNIGKIVVDISP
jgi:putative PIG3 family NAD(P)H quinone oxidoreductase